MYIHWREHLRQQEQNAPFFLGPEETDGACLLIHGFSATPAEMRGLGEALAAQGMRVLGIVVKGHEGNPEGLINATVQDVAKLARSGVALRDEGAENHPGR
jgi:carboxylesterase